jgi:hypothetical protein
MLTRILSPKVWAQIHRVVRVVILPVKGNTHETLLKHVAAADVEFDGSFAKLTALYPDQTVFRLLRHVYGVLPILDSGDLPSHCPQLHGSQPLGKVDLLRPLFSCHTILVPDVKRMEDGVMSDGGQHQMAPSSE